MDLFSYAVAGTLLLGTDKLRTYLNDFHIFFTVVSIVSITISCLYPCVNEQNAANFIVWINFYQQLYESLPQVKLPVFFCGGKIFWLLQRSN